MQVISLHSYKISYAKIGFLYYEKADVMTGGKNCFGEYTYCPFY